MKKKKLRLLRLLKLAYLKLFRINDTPQKTALGLGLGIFLGILPGTGPIAALLLAGLLRLNRAAALLGSLLTNTWINIVTFALALKIGACILRMDSQALRNQKIALALILGYLLIAFCLGLITYLTVLIILMRVKKDAKKPAD